MSAVISPCGNYRYALSRTSMPGVVTAKRVLFIGVNPSTADANRDDATVRKWRGFSHRWGYTAFDVVNLFAYRATNVRELAGAVDPVGFLNDDYIQSRLDSADMVVPCWGSRGKLPPSLRPRIEVVTALVLAAKAPVRVLGLTASGDPCHPLMLPYTRALMPWVPAP